MSGTVANSSSGQQRPRGGDAIVLSATGLTRYFGRKCAVDSVSFTVPRGCVLAILGRNGSGKTTLLRMLMGLLTPTRGRGTVLGHDSSALPPSVLARVGFVAEGHPLYGWMRVGELASFQKQFYPAWNQRAFEMVLEHFALARNAKAGSLSRGERGGLALALVLATEPELLVLDDPAMGLDPVARRSLLEAMVEATRQRQRTIIFSSHLLEDVERVADRIIILDRSVLRADSSLEGFRAAVQQFVLRFVGEVPALPPLRGLLRSEREDGELRLVIANADEQTRAALRSLRPVSMEQVPIGFDDAVIGYMGYHGRSAPASRGRHRRCRGPDRTDR
jgi:ABC-2 type transport system ATP-binding protein